MPNEISRDPNHSRGLAAAPRLAVRRNFSFTWIGGLLAGMAALLLLVADGFALSQGAEVYAWPFLPYTGISLALAVWAIVALAGSSGRRGGKGHAIAGLVVSILAALFCGLCFFIVSVVPMIKTEIARQQAAQQNTPYPPPGSTPYGRSPAPAPTPVETEFMYKEKARAAESARRLEILRRVPLVSPAEESVSTESFEVETLDLTPAEESNEPLATGQANVEGARITTLKLPIQSATLGQCEWSADGKRLLFLASGRVRAPVPRRAADSSSSAAARERGKWLAPPPFAESELIEISLPDWTARRRLVVPSDWLAVSKQGILLLGSERLLVLDPETWKLKRELYLPDSQQLSVSPDGLRVTVRGRMIARDIGLGPGDMTSVVHDNNPAGVPGNRRPRDIYSRTEVVDPVTKDVYRCENSRSALLVLDGDSRSQKALIRLTRCITPRILVHPAGRKLLVDDMHMQYWIELDSSSTEDKKHG
jgi:hypothetical protein